jgi:DNA-binding CsgD family transcriptional regulator
VALHLADLCEVPFERAQTLVVLAELKLTQGERDVPELDEARSICLRLDARRVLGRIDGISKRIDAPEDDEKLSARLTPREMDVLRLLGQHRTDKEIADLLYISPHTASTHVKHVLNKLGAASRREAAEVAVDCGLN